MENAFLAVLLAVLSGGLGCFLDVRGFDMPVFYWGLGAFTGIISTCIVTLC